MPEDGPRRRDAERSRMMLLEAALEEFSEHGFAGARVDRIAARAGVSKPLIYDYFGDKDAVYEAVLREAFARLRRGERALVLDMADPPEAIRTVVRFIMERCRSEPWFIHILNTENMLGGGAVRRFDDAELRSDLADRFRAIVEAGVAQGVFRPVDPVGLYLSIAGICCLPTSHAHTLEAVFAIPFDDDWYARRSEEACEMVLRFLAP